MKLIRRINTAIRVCISDIVDGRRSNQKGHSIITSTGIEVRRVTITGFVIQGVNGSGEASFTLIYDGTAAVRVKKQLAYASQLNEDNHGQLLMVLGRVGIDREGIYLAPELVRRLRNKDFPCYIQRVPCVETQASARG